jgi:hypothetical protein
MLGVVCLLAAIDGFYFTPDGPKPRPAPIAARWLLKYAPADLPALPTTFFDNQWQHGNAPRSLRGAYTEWFQFPRDSLTAPPEVSITHAAWDVGEGGRTTTLRKVPLAVNGPLVEFDGHLHTAAITNWEKDSEKKPRWVLNLGAAVEVGKNVWYQAGSERFTDGKVRVREYRLEFADDPRAKDAGKVKVFTSERFATQYEGETTEVEGEFVATKTRESGPRQVVSHFKFPGKGVGHVKLVLGDGYYPSVIEGVGRSYPAVLTAALVPAPKVAQEPPPHGLMQPPKKPQR